MLRRPFLVCVLALVSGATYAQDCTLQRADNQAQVVHVYDGDTIKLKNGNRVRILGINTPELNDAQRNTTLAQRARLATESLLDHHNHTVLLKYDQERYDKHHRILAHVFLPDGQNLAAQLIAQGLGFWITVGANQQLIQCYYQAELTARKNKLGIWQDMSFAPLNVEQRSPHEGGFTLIQGRVQRAFATDSNYWLQLDGNVRLRLPRQYWRNFPTAKGIQLKNQVLLTRGWLYNSDRYWNVTVTHPLLIEWLN